MGMLMRRSRKHQEKLADAKKEAEKEINALWDENAEKMKVWNSSEKKSMKNKPKSPSRALIQKIKDGYLSKCGDDPQVAHKKKLHAAKKAASEEISKEQQKLNDSEKPRLISREKRDDIIKKHLDKVGKAPGFAPTRAEKRVTKESFNPYRGKKPGNSEAPAAPAKEEAQPEQGNVANGSNG